MCTERGLLLCESACMCCVRLCLLLPEKAGLGLLCCHLYASTATSTCCSAMTLSKSDSDWMGSPSG